MEEYPPKHLDLSRVQNRANPKPRQTQVRKTSSGLNKSVWYRKPTPSRQMHEYAKDRKGVYGHTKNSQQREQSDADAAIMAGLILFSICSLGLGLPLLLGYILIRRARAETRWKQDVLRHPTTKTNSH